MTMKRAIYTERKTLVKYDDNRYMAYLNEEVIEDYVPEVREGKQSLNLSQTTPIPVSSLTVVH